MPATISAISTAVPDYLAQQSQLAEFMINRLTKDEEVARQIRILYRASGIRQRYSVLDDFVQDRTDRFNKEHDFPTIRDRMKIYESCAAPLAKKALSGLSACIPLNTLTHLIVVSCTGMYAPGLEIDLIEELGLPTTIERTAIHFMGCYAAFNGIKAAKHIVDSDQNAKVAVVCVELCSIHLQKDTTEDGLLSNALFGDGAAAALITNGGQTANELVITSQFSDLALAGKKEMSWHIGDFGFEMKLSPKVPDVIAQGINELTDRLLKKVSMTPDQIAYYAIHPGGKRILEVIQQAMNLKKEDLSYSQEVLRSHGNMSSPTVLFVLKSLMDRFTDNDHGKHVLSFAFGPGLTLESLLLQVHGN
ncbi:MAG: alpha-pyrone synthase [Paraglaciecola sp.]|jgi:alpha-pyrone synthase